MATFAPDDFAGHAVDDEGEHYGEPGGRRLAYVNRDRRS